MELNEKVKVFTALSDPLRLRVIELLSEKGQACGKELSESLGVSVALISHHIKLLEESGLVLRKKDGQYSRFSINEDTFQRIRDVPPLRTPDAFEPSVHA